MRRQGGGRRGPLRRAAGWLVRLGVAGAVAYGLLWGAQEGYAYATTSPRFEVRGLSFTTTNHVDDRRVRELMALSPGTNILALDLDEIAARIASDPWVASASVVRVLPDSLDVELVEHEPAAILLAGQMYLVDGRGRPFKLLESGEHGQLPVISGVDERRLLTGSEAARIRVARAMEALEAYAKKRRPRLSEVNVDESGAVTLYTAELGSQLRLGRGPLEPSLLRYDALRAALGEESDLLAVAHLDASPAPDRPDRVVASFFPVKEAPSLVAEAEERASAKGRAAAQAQLEQKARAEGSKRDVARRRRSRIPRYE